MLVFVESEDEVAQYRFKIRRELRTCVFFERGKGTTASFLHALVVVEDHPEELRLDSVSLKLVTDMLGRTPSMVGTKYLFL